MSDTPHSHRRPHTQVTIARPFTLILVLTLFLTTASAHGSLFKPLPRGMLNGANLLPRMAPFDKNAERDYQIHFPAGVKSGRPGSGLRSQMRASGGRWTEFEPLKQDFVWRSSVCGDAVDARVKSHHRGGEFYNGGRIVKTYKAGSVVNFEVFIAAHHNGYFLFHMCDVSKCNGEISAQCFKKPGACVKLKRSFTEDCDRRRSRRCGPIDPDDRSRWYLPCDYPGLDKLGEGNTMQYQLPKGFTCRHCVLQFYWTAANVCNPPGTAKYFTGPSRPSHWSRCRGQAGAIGGYSKVQKTCGGNRFPEEYLQCADVRVVA